jgi:hypothetical protein
MPKILHPSGVAWSGICVVAPRTAPSLCATSAIAGVGLFNVAGCVSEGSADVVFIGAIGGKLWVLCCTGAYVGDAAAGCAVGDAVLPEPELGELPNPLETVFWLGGD